MREASSGSVFLGVEFLAVTTGFAGCLMMVYAFAFILMNGYTIFVEPNIMLASIDLLVFEVGGVGNLSLVARLTKARSRRFRNVL